MKPIEKKVKSVFTELQYINNIHNVTVPRFPFIPKINKLEKRERKYCLHFNAILNKDIETIAQNFAIGDFEILDGQRSYSIKNNTAYFDGYQFLRRQSQMFSLNISQLHDCKINEQQKYYYRFVQPIKGSSWISEINTFGFKTEQSVNIGLLEFDFDDGKVHAYPLSDSNHNNLLVIEPNYKVTLHELQEIQYAVVLGIGLITGIAYFDDAYYIAYEDCDFDSPIGTSYSGLRDTIKGQYRIFTTNMYSLELSLSSGINNNYALSMIKEKDGRIKVGLVDELFKDFYSNLVVNIYRYPEFARAAVILLEASKQSLDYQAALYSVALETLSTKIKSLNQIKYNGVLTKSIWKKVHQEIISSLANIATKYSFAPDIANRFKWKIDGLNGISNNEKFNLVIDSVGYQRTSADDDALHQRNLLLHGNLVQNTSPTSTQFDDIFYYSLMLHRICACVLFKISGFNGYIINNPVLMDTLPACTRKEDLLIRI